MLRCHALPAVRRTLVAVFTALLTAPAVRAQPAPPAPLEFVALTPGNALVRFDAASPATVRRVAITGVKGELRERCRKRRRRRRAR